MTHDARYLIAGGGMAADAAAHGIRQRDPAGRVIIVGAEDDPPYNRPPLSKGLWKGDGFDTIWRPVAAGEVELHLGRTITGIDPARHEATDSRGDTWRYEKLLLATGASPRRLPFGGDDVVYYRTAADYRRLRAAAGPRRSAMVIGGGFIGSEVAAALAMNGCNVTMIFPEPAITARLFPADLATHLLDYYREKGVEVLPGINAQNVVRVDEGLAVTLSDGTRRVVDAVVAGVGVTPNADVARKAGITVDDGIAVNEHLQTSVRDVYAAGDVARFHSPQLGKTLRVEHEDNALTMGAAAGRAMAGDDTPYTHLPFFYSDLFDLGYEAVGEMDARLETVADWKTPFREGVIYYLRDDRVRGVLLWGIFGKVDEARAVIADPAPVDAGRVRGRIVI